MVANALAVCCKWMLYLMAAVVILIALLLASVRLAVLYSDDRSEELASVVSSFVGSPVEIGEVDLLWNRFDASASLKDVQIRSADNKETLVEFPQIELELDVRDVLLERRLSVRSVQLSNLSLAASYEGGGQLRMFGKRLGRKNSDAATLPGPTQLADNADPDSAQTPDGTSRTYSVLNWLFNAERIAILDSEITLIDATEDREYKVENVNIRAFNQGDQHQIRISSALPGDTGKDSLAAFDFTGDADNVSEWKGNFYINTHGLDVAELSTLWRAPEQEFAGTAQVQLWGAWAGTQITKVRAIASATDFYMQHPSASGSLHANLNADEVNVDLDWFRLDSGWQLTFNQLAGSLNDHKLDFDGLEMQALHEADEQYFSLAGPDIDLQTLQPVYSYVDALLPKELPFKAQTLRSGKLVDWRVSGVVTDDKKQLTELRVKALDVTTDPYDKTPGISGLTASVLFEDGTGVVSLNNDDIVLLMPALFDAPMPSLNVNGAIKFLIDSDAGNTPAVKGVAEANTDDGSDGSTDAPSVTWKAVSEDFRIASLDFETSSVFSISGQSDGGQLIDSHTTIQSANLARAKDYLPVRIMSPTLVNWLQTSILDGDAVRGRVEVKGDLADFSPADGRGHFYAEADLIGATLKFLPDWPAVANMDGNLSFSSTSMRGRVYQGSFREAVFSDARLFLPDFTQAVVEIKTNAIGPLDDMLDFVQTGPLAEQIGEIFGDSSGNGTSRVTLDLKIPLKDELDDKLAVNGEVRLDNAQINSSVYGINLESVTGRAGFNQRGVSIDDLQVRYQGLPMAVNAVQKSDAKNHFNRIRVKGPVAVASVLNSYNIPLIDQFEGTSEWTVDLDVTTPISGAEPRIELTATSDLAGTELKFPVPLNKSAQELHQARIYRDFTAQAPDWWIELPGLMKTRVRTSADNESELESVAIALGESTNNILPWRGISVQGDAHRIDVDGWLQFSIELEEKTDTEQSLPLFAKVRTGQMAVGDIVFDDLMYIAYRDGDAQVHRVENALVTGEVRLQQGDDSDQPWAVRLDRLDKRVLVAFADTQEVKRATGKVTDRSLTPLDIPPLDVRVSELLWDDWRFSKVGLRTESSEEGLRITSVTGRQNTMRFSGTGFWRQDTVAGITSDSTTLDVTASFDDFGRAMNDIVSIESFAGGTGEAALSLTWPSPAYSPDLNELRGQFLFNLRNGRILSVQPGAGRMLGLFALQSLPRRLAFDFRDITDNGLEYTGVGGNMTIANGRAKANAIAMSGPVAEILIHGDTDFVNYTYDQTIEVLPRVTGALPLLGVLSGGPAAGLTALLASGVLKGIGVNLDELGRHKLSLTGTWDDPIWTNVSAAPRRNSISR